MQEPFSKKGEAGVLGKREGPPFSLRPLFAGLLFALGDKPLAYGFALEERGSLPYSPNPSSHPPQTFLCHDLRFCCRKIINRSFKDWDACMPAIRELNAHFLPNETKNYVEKV